MGTSPTRRPVPGDLPHSLESQPLDRDGTSGSAREVWGAWFRLAGETMWPREAPFLIVGTFLPPSEAWGIGIRLRKRKRRVGRMRECVKSREHTPEWLGEVRVCVLNRPRLIPPPSLHRDQNGWGPRREFPATCINPV